MLFFSLIVNLTYIVLEVQILQYVKRTGKKSINFRKNS